MEQPNPRQPRSDPDVLEPPQASTPVAREHVDTLSPWAWRAMFNARRPRSERVPAAIREAGNKVWLNETPWPFVMLGEAGSGKTCAALLMLDKCEGSTWYQTFDQLCERARFAKLGQLQTSRGYSVSETEVWQEYVEAHFAVLDDIGIRERASDHVYECLYRALTKREERSLVCASNLTLAELELLFDDRVTSRLSAGTVVHVGGDQRQEQGVDVRQ
jgi:DNA replication protein DnaC